MKETGQEDKENTADLVFHYLLFTLTLTWFITLEPLSG